MVTVFDDEKGQPQSVEANMTGVDLPASVNYGYGATEAEAVDDLRQRVVAYVASLQDLDFAVVIR